MQRSIGNEVWVEEATLQQAPQAVNAGFEDPLTYAPDLYPWILVDTSTAGVTTSAANSGTSSLSVTGGVYQDVAGLKPGQRYEIRAWAQEGATGAEAILMVDDRAARNLETIRQPVSNTSFEELGVVFTATQTGAARIQLSSVMGAIYWDDVTIVESKTPQPANDGFESGMPGTVSPWVGGAPSSGTGRTGTNSLQLGSGQNATQTVAGLIVGKEYKVIAWAQGTVGGSAKLAVKNGAQLIAETLEPSFATSAFQMFSIDFAAPSTDISTHLESVNGMIHWDDVSVLVTGTPFSGPGIILRGRYEGTSAASLNHLDLVVDSVAGIEKCWVRYDPSPGEFLLIGDDNTTILQPHVAPSSATTVSKQPVHAAWHPLLGCTKRERPQRRLPGELWREHVGRERRLDSCRGQSGRESRRVSAGDGFERAVAQQGWL